MVWAGLSWQKKQEDWQNPVEGIVTSSCGRRINPILKKAELHNGIDIAVPTGTEVTAVKSGTITTVRTSATLGKVVEYETKDGYRVMYAHLSKPLVQVGDEVKQGQAVAESGNTGLSTGPHLHYSLWDGAVLLDPLDFVTLDYTAEVSAEYEARGEIR